MHTEIPKADQLTSQVFRVNNEKDFRQIALGLFRMQFLDNRIYRDYCTAVGKTPATVERFEQIPFLPIRFFKSHMVKTGDFDAETIFRSSGTTGGNNSQHHVKQLSIYEQSFLSCFETFFGNPHQYCILGLLPSYLEQGASSLVYMVNELINRSGHTQSGFYLYEHRRLQETLAALEKASQPTILFGVTYALLDFAETSAFPLWNTIIIETGGMKGRKKELTRNELYSQLNKAFSIENIHSE
jgi:hypothetical protein